MPAAPASSAATRPAACPDPASTRAAYPAVSAAARRVSATGTIVQAAESACSAAIASRTMTGALQAARRAARAASPATTAVAANAHCGVASNPPSQKIPTPTAATARPVASAFTNPLWRVLRRVVDELEVRHLGGVPLARADLDDARVATRPIGEPGTHVREELVDDVLRAEVGEGLTARVQVSPPPQRDHLLRDRADGLGFRHGGPDPAVLDQRTGEIRVQRPAVRGVAAELLSRTLVAHVLIPRLPGGSDRAWRASP